jgi:Tfp pilus assembly protein PilE
LAVSVRLNERGVFAGGGFMKLKQQRGMTFVGLLFVGVLVVFAGVTMAQVVPSYIEFMAVEKAVQRASAGTTVREVRDLFDRAAQADDISSIGSKDLDIGKEGDKVVVSFNYAREIHLVGPAYLVMKYAGSSK